MKETKEGKCNLIHAISYIETCDGRGGVSMGGQCAVGRGGRCIWCWSNVHPKLPMRHHATTRLGEGVLATIAHIIDPFGW